MPGDDRLGGAGGPHDAIEGLLPPTARQRVLAALWWLLLGLLAVLAVLLAVYLRTGA